MPAFSVLSERYTRAVARRLGPVLLAAICVVVAGLVLFDPPEPAGAAVEHGVGFSGSVAGYRSWYGSYRLGDLGEVWCVDHGIRAPDVVLGYEPTSLDDHGPDTRRAIAWAVGRHGPGADPVGAAALMLVLHDLMGAEYPRGRLSVDELRTDDLRGFDGHEAAVIERARAIKADAVSRASLVGPLRLEVSAEAVADGRRGRLQARLLDADGRPLEGVLVHPAVTGATLQGTVDQLTDPEGSVAWEYLAAAGPNTFDLMASVPGVELRALRPTVRPAQRVAQPAAVVVRGQAAFDGTRLRGFSILKRGDGEPWLPVTGAEFTVRGPDTAVLTTGPDGHTERVEVQTGRYEVVESKAPEGYEPAGPWTVDVGETDVTLEVTDLARRGRLRIEKVDALSGAPVAGAVFEVRADLDQVPDDFEVEVGDPDGPVLPGRYQVREVAAPPGYRLASEPVVVGVRAGEETVARVADEPLVTLAFVKSPALAGAVFAVAAPDGAVVGRCSTDDGGRCALPEGAVPAGSTFCWTEELAPAGWARAEGACDTLTTEPGATHEVHVLEVALPAPPAAPAATTTVPAPSSTTTTSTTEQSISAVLAAAPSPPPTAPPAPVAPAHELPRTGASPTALLGAGVALIGAGLMAAASSEASSWGSRDRRGRRRRRPAVGARRCRS